MANITLGTLRDLWKVVSDWVTGATASKPAVRAVDIETLLGALADVAVTNPALAASQIALLKGLLTKLADPATQTTLAALNGKDFATEITLAAANGVLTAIRDTAGVKKIVDAVDISDRAARALGVVTAADGGLVSIGAKADPAVTDPTAAAAEIQLLKGLLKQLQGTGSGSAPVTLNGSVPAGTNDIGKVQLFVTSETCSAAPIVGVKTVTATAAEIFAGAAVRANRRKLTLKNEDPVLCFRVGPATVTQQNGLPVEPGALVEFVFDPTVAVPIYAISDGASLSVAVMEI